MFENLEPDHGPPYSVQDIDIQEEQSEFGRSVVVETPRFRHHLAIIDDTVLGATNLCDAAVDALEERGYDVGR